MTALKIITAGGFTIYILIFCSVLSIAIIIERYLYYRSRSRIKRHDLMVRIKKELENNDKYVNLKQSLKDLSAGKREVDKRQKAIILVALSLLNKE